MFVIHNYMPYNVCIIIESELIHKCLFAGTQHLTQAVTPGFELPPCLEWIWQLQSSGTTEVREITAAEEQIKYLKKNSSFLSPPPTWNIQKEAPRTPQFWIKKKMNIIGSPASLYTCLFHIWDTYIASLQWLFPHIHFM